MKPDIGSIRQLGTFQNRPTFARNSTIFLYRHSDTFPCNQRRKHQLRVANPDLDQKGSNFTGRLEALIKTRKSEIESHRGAQTGMSYTNAMNMR